MIVVAIIGILAAVAIPGFMQYIKNSKTSEAKTNLKTIADGAVSYFETEHTQSADGMKIFTKQYPHCGTKDATTGAVTLAACAATNNPLGSAPSASTIGTKFDPNDYQSTVGEGGSKTASGFAAEPWVSLKFTISKPFYYYYTYASKITAGGTSATSAKFNARASASLSENQDSNYSITGDEHGTVGNIVELDSYAVATTGT